jgi:uncharacterized membrane protein YhaH (DUF805 family)
MQDLSPIGWALRPLKRYAQFSGRSSRAEFWWFTLFLMIVYVLFWIVLFATMGATAASMNAQSPGTPALAMFGALGVFGIVMMLFWLALLVPIIAVQVRRLHDSDRSGWWLGAFWLLYIVYMVTIFSSAFMMAPASNGSPPNMGAFAAVGVIALITFVYSIVLLVFFCMPGTKGPNRFGDDPYGADVEQVFA